MNNRKATIALALIVILSYGLFFDFFDQRIFRHLMMSLSRMCAGYCLSVIIGILFAIFLGLSRYFRMAFKPLLSFMISIPTITWVPLLLIVTGISEKTIITAIFLGSFFTIVYNTLEGFENVSINFIRVAEVMGYSNLEVLFKIYMPASFNNILVGLKLGIAYSWRALVGAEMLAAAEFGLGYLVFASRKFYEVQTMFLSLALIGIFGYIMTRLLVAFVEEKTISKWGLS